MLEKQKKKRLNSCKAQKENRCKHKHPSTMVQKESLEGWGQLSVLHRTKNGNWLFILLQIFRFIQDSKYRLYLYCMYRGGGGVISGRFFMRCKHVNVNFIHPHCHLAVSWRCWCCHGDKFTVSNYTKKCFFLMAMYWFIVFAHLRPCILVSVGVCVCVFLCMWGQSCICVRFVGMCV